MNLARLVAGIGAMALSLAAHAGPLSEDFSDISLLAGKGWVQTNNSSSGGTSGWFQGSTGGALFTGQSGDYIGANFANTGLGGDISNWLISPDLVLTGGATLSFYARTDDAGFGDSLEVRFSSGPGADVGLTTTSLGSFTSLLLTVGPTGTAFPDTGWGLFTVTLPSVAEGRFAFRYVVSNTALNGDYIGIDTVDVTPAVPEPSTYLLMAFGVGALTLVARKRRVV